MGARRRGPLNRMPRHLRPGERLVIASHNPGKVEEIEALLMPYGVAAIGAGALGLPEPEETGASFEANAALKARAAAAARGLPALADDSGLVVPALDGAPGIYSARWAGPTKDFRIAMERVQRELGDKPRNAHFVAVLALAWADGGTRTAAITGSYVALHHALAKFVAAGLVPSLPLNDSVAAISCGVVDGVAVLDLDYAEDSSAETDANFVLTGGGGIVEIQATAEGAPFDEASFTRMLALARAGIAELMRQQRAALGLV